MKLKKITNRLLRPQKEKVKGPKKSIISYRENEYRPSPRPKSYNSSDTEEDSRGPVTPSPPAKTRDGINIVTPPDGEKLSFSDERNVDFDKTAKSTEDVQNDKPTTENSVQESNMSSKFSENVVGSDIQFDTEDEQRSKLSSVNLGDQNSASQHSSSPRSVSLKDELSLFSHETSSHETRNIDVVVLKKPPTARQAAFSGPPRYDWIDVEASAALKVQSLYRRHKVTSELQRQGIVTSVMQRKSQQHRARGLDNDRMLTTFNCCSFSSLFQSVFNDADESNIKAQKEVTYQDKKKAQAEAEEKLRKFKMRNRYTDKLIESIEVVV